VRSCLIGSTSTSATSPRGELATEELLRRVTATDDGTRALRAFALNASHETDGSRWSYSRGLGRNRLVVIDSRAGRVLKDGQRSMTGPDSASSSRRTASALSSRSWRVGAIAMRRVVADAGRRA
jgi:hypothetical protein